MPIDAGIYSQIQQPQAINPLASMAQAYQIKHLQQQGEQADMAAQQQNKLMQLVGSQEFGSLPVTEQARALQGVGAFKQAGDLVTTHAAAAKDTRSAQETELNMAIKRHEVLGGALGALSQDPSQAPVVLKQLVDGGVMDPAYAQKVLQQAASAPDPSKFFSMGAQAAVSAKEQLAQKTQIRGQDITMRGQDLTQGTALRGQDLSRQTALETNANSVNATTRGQDLVNQRALDAQGNGKMTEDQGKATGWLVQAENAFKNMKSAAVGDDGKVTSAAKPGINDAIAEIPFMGGIANSMRSDKRQMFMQGASSLSEALLRAATGAGVNKDEAKQKIEELTPVFGDSDAKIEQKMNAIPLYIESLKVRAGPGAAKAEKVLGSQSPGTPTAKPDVGGLEAEMRRRGLLK